MRVGFDISQSAHRGGVATYTDNLSKFLSKEKDLDVVYFYSSLRKPYHGNLKNVRSFPIPPTILEVALNKFRFPSIEWLIGEVDIFHSSDWLQPKTKAKKVTTYHDVVPLKFPQWSHPQVVRVHKRRLEIVEKEIDMVIAVSEATKQDLIEISRIPAEKIIVIYEGVGDQFHLYSEEQKVDFRRRMGLPNKFVLALGGIGERKNLPRIKEAAKDYKLVITGDTIPWVREDELPLLYASAQVLLYPSLYEGFGLPILEAMACGLPVITSNVSSMPEVGGKAAVYIDPTDLSGMRRVVREIWESGEIREEMKKKGLLQAKKFSWDKCAKETVQVYRSLI